MKPIYVSLLTICVLFTACKKDSGDDETSPSMFVLKAPSCLIIQGSSPYREISLFYDSQKRLLKQSTSHDSDMITYTYSGNTMLETITSINDDGSIDTYNTLHYLNATGFIDSSVEEYSGQSYAKIHQYDSQGYLIRSYRREPSGRVRPYLSYQYSNGNRVAAYRINTDWEGNITDSPLVASYIYDTNMKGYFEEWEAWTGRTGRASANAVKTTQSDNDFETRTITTGANNLPSEIDVETTNGSYSLSLFWKCN